MCKVIATMKIICKRTKMFHNNKKLCKNLQKHLSSCCNNTNHPLMFRKRAQTCENGKYTCTSMYNDNKHAKTCIEIINSKIKCEYVHIDGNKHKIA